MGCDGSRPADCSIYKSIYKTSILDLSTPLKEDRATIWTTLHAAAQPLHLSELICHYLQSRSLRSSNTNLLARPSWITTATFPRGFFSVSAPSTWKCFNQHSASAPLLSYCLGQFSSVKIGNVAQCIDVVNGLSVYTIITIYLFVSGPAFSHYWS